MPIYQTSTYVQEAVGLLKQGYDYSRTANPTRRALERCLASLESAGHGFAFASGMAATTTVMHLVDPGQRVVSVNDVYGGTYRLFSKVYEPKGYEFTYVDAPSSANERLAEHLDEQHATGLAGVADQPAAERRRHRRRGATPRTRSGRSSWWTTPSPRRTCSGRWSWAPTSCVHSTTKYLGGHSDLVGGFAGDLATTRWPSGWGSSRTAWAPCPARSTPGWCCAG